MVGLGSEQDVRRAAFRTELDRSLEGLSLCYGAENTVALAAVEYAYVAAELVGELAAADRPAGYHGLYLAAHQPENIGVVVGEYVVELDRLFLYPVIDADGGRNGFSADFKIHRGNLLEKCFVI